MKSKSALACYIQESKHFRAMRLQGQDDAGYAMAVLLVAMSVAAIMMTVAMPVWKQTAQREKEDELVFRGLQYVRALRLFSTKYANAAPPSVDVLVEQRFLRKKYKDPITNDDFQPILAGQAIPGAGGTAQQGAGRGAGGASGARGATGSTPFSGASTQFGSGISGSAGTQSQPGRGGAPGTSPIGSPGAGAVGGIMGVVSKSKEKSIRLYQGRSHYNEWAFINTPQTQTPGAGAPGSAVPGRGTGPGQGTNPFGSGVGPRGGTGGQGQQPGGRGPGGFPIQPGQSPFQPVQSPFGTGQPQQPIQPGRGRGQ
jgi:type II secretory pathway pseudopilin PulG